MHDAAQLMAGLNITEHVCLVKKKLLLKIGDVTHSN